MTDTNRKQRVFDVIIPLIGKIAAADPSFPVPLSPADLVNARMLSDGIVDVLDAYFGGIKVEAQTEHGDVAHGFLRVEP